MYFSMLLATFFPAALINVLPKPVHAPDFYEVIKTNVLHSDALLTFKGKMINSTNVFEVTAYQRLEHGESDVFFSVIVKDNASIFPVKGFDLNYKDDALYRVNYVDPRCTKMKSSSKHPLAELLIKPDVSISGSHN